MKPNIEKIDEIQPTAPATEFVGSQLPAWLRDFVADASGIDPIALVQSDKPVPDRQNKLPTGDINPGLRP